MLAGGPDTDGLLAEPTVLTGVGGQARLVTEEAFAPVVTLHAVRDEDALVAEANRGEFGLIAAVLSADTTHALQVARRLRAGAVHVNGPSVGDEPHVPFGGLGLSGTGRLGGAESWQFFTEQRTFYLHGESLL